MEIIAYTNRINNLQTEFEVKKTGFQLHAEEDDLDRCKYNIPFYLQDKQAAPFQPVSWSMDQYL